MLVANQISQSMGKTTGEIHPLFARAGFVGFAVGCAHDVAAAVAGNDLGGIGHERLGRVEWIKGMFAAAWLPCGEKVLYRNRQGSSETILYRVHLNRYGVAALS